MMADPTYEDPDTHETLTPTQYEARKEDCAARLTKTRSELNELLRRAAAFGLDRRVVVLPNDETRTRYMPPESKVVYLPQRLPGLRYQMVLVLPPDVDVAYPDDPRHPDHPKGNG
jgi:hypothetical protein